MKMLAILLAQLVSKAATQEFVTCRIDSPCDVCPEGQAIFPIESGTFANTGICVSKTRLAAEPFDYPENWQTEEAHKSGDGLFTRKGGKGWYIENNVLKECEAGYYCPFNETAGYYDRTVKCKDGEVCYNKVVEPFKCNWFYICNGKTLTAGPGGVIVIVCFLLTLVVGTLIATRGRRRFLAESQRLALEHAQDDVDEGFAADFRGESHNLVTPASVSFENVGLTLKGTHNVTILDGVSGTVPPQSLVALMGPSGCGKTTFMNTLLKDTPYGIATGTVKVNNDTSTDLRKDKLCGFVPQDDIVHAELTVFQNLYYNAMTRLPSNMPVEKKKKHVQNVIKVLGLTKVQNALVGSPEKRGVSGGQKKRVNIGMELVAMPSFLFMDEPTSGLDGAATVSLAKCMSVLRSAGLSIMCVIHQPRQLVFNEFTHVLLLGEGGKTVYWGRREMLVPYLESLGFSNSQNENPADWMIDVCSGHETRIDPATGQEDKEFVCPDNLFALWEQEQKPNVFSNDFKWTQGDPSPAELAQLQKLEKRTGASLGQSIYYLTQRAFQMVTKSTFFCHLVVIVCVSLANLIAIILTPDRKYDTSEIQTKVAVNMLYYLVIVVQARNDYGGKMLETMRELNAGMSLIGTWFGIFIRSFCLAFCKAFTFSAITYTLDSPFQDFGIYFCSYFLGTLCWTYFAHWMCVWFTNPVTVMLLLVLTNGVEMLSNGTACAIEGESAGTLCPGFFPPVWLPPYYGGAATVGFYQFLMLYGAELDALPKHFANDSIVNGTNYYRLVVAGLDNWQGAEYTGPTHDGDDGPYLSLDETVKIYDKLANPDYNTPVSLGALMMAVLIVLHNLWLIWWLNRGLAWVKSASWDKQRKDCLNDCGSFCGIGAALEHVFNLKPPPDVQEFLVWKNKGGKPGRVKPTRVNDNLPEVEVVNNA